MLCVLLAGGLGTRMKEETEFKPKPMLQLGTLPAIVHVMKIYAHAGVREFLVLTGYRHEIIANFFANPHNMSKGLKVNPSTGELSPLEDLPDWEITVLDTGLQSQTADRLIQARDFLEGRDFLCSYGDSLANVDVAGQIAHFHERERNLVTVSKFASRFGVVELGKDSNVKSFREKPTSSDYASIGFFAFKGSVIDELQEGTMFEDSLIPLLASRGRLDYRIHDGFWEPMDTQREYEKLGRLALASPPPWLNL